MVTVKQTKDFRDYLHRDNDTSYIAISHSKVNGGGYTTIRVIELINHAINVDH